MLTRLALTLAPLILITEELLDKTKPIAKTQLQP